MKVITCFSYKGGAGRTVAAANIAAALASTEENVGAIQKPLRRKVAILDLDVFSAGTHRVFGIGNSALAEKQETCVQRYLRDDMQPSEYFDKGALTLESGLMETFRRTFSAAGNCRPDFTLFPAHPEPGKGWVVQKLHENILLDLVQDLEGRLGYHYLIIDGESGSRSMADIALRLADVALVFFRLTWQHTEGTLDTAEEWENQSRVPQFYLIPTCVPLVGEGDEIYRDDAPGLNRLRDQTEAIPDETGLDKYVEARSEGAGYFWSKKRRMCVHDSLILKGGERIVVFEPEFRKDRAAQDYYNIAAEIDKMHGKEIAADRPGGQDTASEGSR